MSFGFLWNFEQIYLKQQCASGFEILIMTFTGNVSQSAWVSHLTLFYGVFIPLHACRVWVWILDVIPKSFISSGVCMPCNASGKKNFAIISENFSIIHTDVKTPFVSWSPGLKLQHKQVGTWGWWHFCFISETTSCTCEGTSSRRKQDGNYATALDSNWGREPFCSAMHCIRQGIQTSTQSRPTSLECYRDQRTPLQGCSTWSKSHHGGAADCWVWC